MIVLANILFWVKNQTDLLEIINDANIVWEDYIFTNAILKKIDH